LPKVWDKTDPGLADIAFRNRDDHSTISLNSVCDQYQDLTVEELSKTLMLGLEDSEVISTEEIIVNSLRGLTTSIAGEADGVSVVVSISILRSPRCVYDFMLVARRVAFEQHRPTFINLVQSFRESGTQ
jgi:hypothetical protein